MSSYLSSVVKQLEYHKKLGEKTFAQLDDDNLFWQFNTDSNSIATIVKHLSGNMISRWTNFLTTDGEKTDRNRDAEFDNDLAGRQQVMDIWQQGWKVLFNSLNTVHHHDLEKIVYIRNQAHTVTEAINRQLAHYAYHIGQIVLLGKMLATNWQTLSIAKNASRQFNTQQGLQPKHPQQTPLTD